MRTIFNSSDSESEDSSSSESDYEDEVESDEDEVGVDDELRWCRALHPSTWHDEMHDSGGVCSVMKDFYCSKGQLNRAKWLHRNCEEKCTSAAMDGSATNGHFDVVQWLQNKCFGGDLVQWQSCALSEFWR
jgi:U3 small nucleolar RNA-associated protein 14